MDPAEIRILLEEKLSPQLEGENTIIFLTKQIESRLESIIEDLIDLPPGKMDENILDYLSISRNFGLHGITNTLTELIAEKVGIPVIEKVLSPKKKIKQTELEFEYLLTQGKNLSWIQPGLTYGAHEVNCASGRLDILATNSQGKKVMIELKYADYEDYQVYHQLKKYMGNFSQRQMIFAAPVIKSGLWFALQEDGYFIDNRLTCFEFKKIEDHYEFREITRSDFPEEVKPSFITSPTPKKKSSSPIRTFVTLPKKPTSASPNILTTKVKAITQTMHELFTNYRHHPDYSFWGIAYFWSGEQFNEKPNGDLIPTLLKQIPEIDPTTNTLGVKNPHKLAPEAHQIMNCLKNRQALENHLQKILPSSSYLQTLPLLNDSHLAQEAITHYVSAIEKGIIPQKTDFLQFLVAYNIKNEQLEKNLPYQGTFQHLATRAIIRYSEFMPEEQIFDLVPGDLSNQARAINLASIYGEIQVSPELLDLYAFEIGNQNFRPSDLNLSTSYKLIILEQRKRRHPISLDWNHYFKKRKQQITMTHNTNLEGFLRMTIRNKYLQDSYFNHPENLSAGINSIRQQTEAAWGIKKELLLEVQEILSGAY